MDSFLKDVIYDALTNKIESESHQEKLVNYQNTYRLESKNSFSETKALEVVQEEIEKYIKIETKYDAQKAAGICAALSQAIRDRIHDMNFDRYKIVCIVDIGEKKGQGVMSIVRFLRDSNKDKYIVKTYENNFLFVSIMIGALYYE
ncbi:dynein light chain Tctex-type protein 2B-like isoform X2 [Daktulosphaira vitifoliae]|uniref:dynein light chain Tctex-type protein 2B-like isoform X2 n=1 Tax=Daktulosphaira vitifoliae TaxID=58002 RepID=UPI0021AAF2BE|nr:dynein light chain Tctex-type protein 2B-like isoform X2 [Daktulosphaira vitifoliae]